MTCTPSIKLYINSRDELNIIHLEKVLFCRSEDNYTKITYTSGQQVMVHLSLTKLQELIHLVWRKDIPSPFYRLGRGLIINQQFVIGLNILKQRLYMTGFNDKTYALVVAKQVLKSYRDLLTGGFAQRSEQ